MELSEIQTAFWRPPAGAGGPAVHPARRGSPARWSAPQQAEHGAARSGHAGLDMPRRRG